MDVFLQQLASGLVSGGVYAALALALVMIFRSTGHLNFAQGEMATFSTFVAWTFVQQGLGIWTALVLTMAISFAMGVAVERLLIRRFNDAPEFSVVIVLVGLLAIFNSLCGWIWDYTSRSFPSLFDARLFPSNRYFSSHAMGVLVVVFVVLGLLWAFFRFTRVGLAMRAAAFNPTTSRLCGARVDLLLATGWGVAAAIGALVGVLVAPIVYLDPNMMSGVLLYAFAAALLGGIDNPSGAVAGGFIVGVAENLLGAYVIGTELKLAGAFFLIVVALIFFPAGLFSRVMHARV